MGKDESIVFSVIQSGNPRVCVDGKIFVPGASMVESGNRRHKTFA